MRDNGAQTASATFGLTIVARLVITTTSLPNGIVGNSYAATLTASGGATPATMSVTGLPPGLSFSQALPTPIANCAQFPTGFVPFTSVAYVSAPNAA